MKILFCLIPLYACLILSACSRQAAIDDYLRIGMPPELVDKQIMIFSVDRPKNSTQVEE